MELGTQPQEEFDDEEEEAEAHNWTYVDGTIQKEIINTNALIDLCLHTQAAIIDPRFTDKLADWCSYRLARPALPCLPHCMARCRCSLCKDHHNRWGKGALMYSDSTRAPANRHSGEAMVDH